LAKARSNPLGILLALGLAEVTVTFETTMIFAATPTLIKTFGDPLLAGQLVAIHPMIAAATAPVAGRLGDLWGRKRVILWLLAIATAGSLISAASDNFWLILIGRALQGLSLAVLSLAIGVLREAIPADKLTMSIGYLGAAPSVGSIAGLLLGGMIIDNFTWHWLFVTSAVIIALSWLAVLGWVPRSKPSREAITIDWIEALLPIPAVAALLGSIGLIGRYPVVSWPVLGTFALGLVFGALWLRRALSSSVPFVDLRLFANRDFAIVNLATLLLAAGAMKVVYLFSIYLQSPAWTGVGLGLSATEAGLAKLPSTFFAVTAGTFASWLAIRTSHRTTFIASCLIAFAGWTYALILPNDVAVIAIVLTVISYGVTMLQTATANIVVTSVPEDRTSEAMGTMSTVRGLGIALGNQLITLSLASFTLRQPGTGVEFPTAYGYRFTMAWIALVTLIGAVLALFLSRERAATSHAASGSV
jgi:MFS family permease